MVLEGVPPASCKFLRSGVKLSSPWSRPLIGSEKTHKEKVHVNKIFTGLSRDFGGDFVYVFVLPQKE